MTPKYIILHHSLTKDTKTVSWGAIRKYHTEVLNWRDIGYHVGIERIGDYTEILHGRSYNTQGAHCRGMNSESLGVCFVGNYDIIKPTRTMWLTGAVLVNNLMEIYNIPLDRVQPHSKFSRKTCPGVLFDVDKFKDDVKRLTHV